MVGQQSSFTVEEKHALIAKDLDTIVTQETNITTPPKTNRKPQYPGNLVKEE